MTSPGSTARIFVEFLDQQGVVRAYAFGPPDQRDEIIGVAQDNLMSCTKELARKGMVVGICTMRVSRILEEDVAYEAIDPPIGYINPDDDFVTPKLEKLGSKL